MAPKKEQKSQGIKLAIRQAGEGGITKQELNNITKTTGANAQTVIRRLDQVNQSLKENDKARIGLNSGAANMLIRQNEKNPAAAFAGIYGGKPQYGTGQIGRTLQSMMGTPATPGYMRQGQMVGGSAGQPGFNPGGNPNKNRMIGGTQIRGGGNIAVRGFGQQYIAPTQPTPEVTPTPTTNNTNDPIPQDPVFQIPEELPEELQDPGAGMLSGGGMGAAGANKLGRAKSRLRQLGIYGRGTGLLNRGLQYGNALNK